jgi:hypothetical protein
MEAGLAAGHAPRVKLILLEALHAWISTAFRLAAIRFACRAPRQLLVDDELPPLVDIAPLAAAVATALAAVGGLVGYASLKGVLGVVPFVGDDEVLLYIVL